MMGITIAAAPVLVESWLSQAAGTTTAPLLVESLVLVEPGGRDPLRLRI